MSNVNEALGRVENRLTVYSQVQRRNVSKDVFRDDLKEIMEEYSALVSPKRDSQTLPSDTKLGILPLKVCRAMNVRRAVPRTDTCSLALAFQRACRI